MLSVQLREAYIWIQRAFHLPSTNYLDPIEELNKPVLNDKLRSSGVNVYQLQRLSQLSGSRSSSNQHIDLDRTGN
jgi:hypothetical protein